MSADESEVVAPATAVGSRYALVAIVGALISAVIGTAKSAGLEAKLLLPGGNTASYRLGSFSSKAKESIPLRS